MNTCKDCKHWGDSPNRNVCQSPKLDPWGEDGDDLAQAEISPEPIVTGKDFGCIHWEKR